MCQSYFLFFYSVYTNLLSSAGGYRPGIACLQNVHFVGKDRAGRTRLLLHKHLVLIAFELVRPRQEGPGLWSVVRVAGGELVSQAET